MTATSKPILAAHNSYNDSCYCNYYNDDNQHHNTDDTLESLIIERRGMSISWTSNGEFLSNAVYFCVATDETRTF